VELPEDVLAIRDALADVLRERVEKLKELGVTDTTKPDVSEREIQSISELVAVDGEIRSFYAFEDWTLEAYGPAQGYQQTFEGFMKAGP
jgi:ERCC4-related helicase